jgi:membrane protein
MQLQQLRRIIAGATNDIDVNHIFSFAAALSYYFVLALFPALISLAAVLAYLPVHDLFDTIIYAIGHVVPPESMGLIIKIVDSVITPHGTLLSLGLVATLWTSSSGFATLIEALNVAYGVPETRPWWKTRLLSIRLTFVVGTLVTVAFAFMVVGPEFAEYLAEQIGLKREFAMLWLVLRYVLAVSFIVLAVEGLYLTAPNIKHCLRSTLPGALIAVVGWLLLSYALGFYFRRFDHLNKTYGVLGGGVGLLTWMYWSGFLILLGAEVNSESLQQCGDGTLTLKEPPPPKV